MDDDAAAARRRPSFGRPRAVRGLDLFDTPPIALGPLFEHEPLLRGVTVLLNHFAARATSLSPCAPVVLLFTPATSSTAAAPIPRCSTSWR